MMKEKKWKYSKKSFWNLMDHFSFLCSTFCYSVIWQSKKKQKLKKSAKSHAVKLEESQNKTWKRLNLRSVNMIAWSIFAKNYHFQLIASNWQIETAKIDNKKCKNSSEFTLIFVDVITFVNDRRQKVHVEELDGFSTN